MNFEKLIKSLSGLTNPELFLKRVYECLKIDIVRGSFTFHGEQYSLGGSESGFNYELEEDWSLKLLFKNQLDDSEISLLNAIFGAGIQNLKILSKLRDASYKGWNHRNIKNKNLVCFSSPMKECIEKAELVAPHNTAVLIQGETGSGKEVLAKYIHKLSDRKQSKFITVNCASLPNTLVESALFGHVKGAFTGANSERKGYFETAKGGTLFLDEIGELPLETQSKLLRVLEYGDFSPVGSDEIKKSDIRIISASHKSLKDAVIGGAFRQDLFYRLTVFPITVPSLRERKEDIAELIEVLLAELYTNLKIPVKKFEPKFFQTALSYDWPGNVRELKNTLEKSLILSKGSVLRLVIENTGIFTKSTIKPFDEEVKEIIEAALSRCSGKVDGIGGAAELLGLKPQTLYSKIRKYKISK